MTAARAVAWLTALVLAMGLGVSCSDGRQPVPQVQRDGRDGDDHEFGETDVDPELRAGAPADVLLKFAVIGDFGTGTQTQLAVADRMCRWRENHPYELVLTTGDNIYDKGEPRFFESRFKRPYACLMDEGVRFRATLGNHDIVTANGRFEVEDPAFGMPKRNYVFRRGSVRFVMVNSNRLNLDWLRDAVRAQDGDLYTVVAMHHPVYSPGSHGSTSGFRPSLPRVFERHGVDLVLAGHDHLYSVTKPLDGIRYVVTGGGGAPSYPCSERWFVDECISRYHFLFVRVMVDRLTVRAVPAGGAVLHSFSVARTP